MTENLETQLQNPENRRIFQLYLQAENRRCSEHLSQQIKDTSPRLEKLLRLFTEVSQEYDPIDSMGEFGLLVKQLETEAETDPSKLDLLEALRMTYGLLQEVFPMVRRNYLAVTKALIEISSAQGVQPQEIVKNKDYMDEVKRKVFPTREDFREYYVIGSTIGLEALKRMGIFITKKKIEGSISDDILELEEALSTSSIERLEEEVRNYREQECNRIYCSSED